MKAPNALDLCRAVAAAEAAYLALKADLALPRTRADRRAIEEARRAWETARAAYVAAHPAGLRG